MTAEECSPTTRERKPLWADAEAAARVARNRAAKQPGMTVAESLGIEVPANAPGGHRITPPAPRAQRHSGSERAARETDLDYDGFVDRDAWT